MLADARACICVFAKPPLPGESKTRLAAATGPADAAILAEAFLRDTWAVVASVPWADPVLAVTRGRSGMRRLARQVWLQGEGDLSERLERVLRRALRRHPQAFALAADIPGLPAHLLDQARAELSRADAVLGPAPDGGFWILGLTRCPPGLLRGIPWSGATTFAATRARLRAERMRVKRLAPFRDVDRPEDLQRIGREIASGKLVAPQTASALAALGLL